MKLILLRHGESQWNKENRFTGWTNVDLTKNGQKEAKRAGLLLKNEKINISRVYVSLLKRAVKTSKICLKHLALENLKIEYHWRLNERHYGNLQGLNKSQTAKKYGDEQVLIWRRSYDNPPPKMSKKNKQHPIHDPLYKNIDHNLLPSCESLKDTLERVKPLWINQIMPNLKIGENILVVAHGNSLRAIVKILKNLSSNDVLHLNIPTGSPYVFDFSENFNLISDFYLESKSQIAAKGD
tara:strand:- start:797 stop:1513 length:717 start_codon:yes stop_codon:yes gene_type:complete